VERDRDVEHFDSSLTRHQDLLHNCGAAEFDVPVPRAGVVISG
jgi:hypothetical protein